MEHKCNLIKSYKAEIAFFDDTERAADIESHQICIKSSSNNNLRNNPSLQKLLTTLTPTRRELCTENTFSYKTININKILQKKSEHEPARRKMCLLPKKSVT